MKRNLRFGPLSILYLCLALILGGLAGCGDGSGDTAQTNPRALSVEECRGLDEVACVDIEGCEPRYPSDLDCSCEPCSEETPCSCDCPTDMQACEPAVSCGGLDERACSEAGGCMPAYEGEACACHGCAPGEPCPGCDCPPSSSRYVGCEPLDPCTRLDEEGCTASTRCEPAYADTCWGIAGQHGVNRCGPSFVGCRESLTVSCERVLCELGCPNGFERDEHGCEVCRCAQSDHGSAD